MVVEDESTNGHINATRSSADLFDDETKKNKFKDFRKLIYNRHDKKPKTSENWLIITKQCNSLLRGQLGLEVEVGQ